MYITAFDLAQRFVGVKEIPGHGDNAQILAMLRLDDEWPDRDEVPWCSAFTNYIAWLLRLPRSKSLLARSWLAVGHPVALKDAAVGFDVVILTRGSGPRNPSDLTLPGHVGWYAGHTNFRVSLLGGNQNDQVAVNTYSRSRVLGVRRLYAET